MSSVINDDLEWQKSSFTDGVQCVEVAREDDLVLPRTTRTRPRSFR